jgi:hypothetical protein
MVDGERRSHGVDGDVRGWPGLAGGRGLWEALPGNQGFDALIRDEQRDIMQRYLRKA